MLERFSNHNQFRTDTKAFSRLDPHLLALSRLKHQYSPKWWLSMNLFEPGIYILTGGRQVGKSTSCKLLIENCLQEKRYRPDQMQYIACDEIFDAKELSETLRRFLDHVDGKFFLIVDEITFVKDWDRVVKALADEGYFTRGIILLTGSDTLILKEAAMRFPGRRGEADKIDFHMYPLSFNEYVKLIQPNNKPDQKQLQLLFDDYLQCGGYLRAINDLAEDGKIKEATYLTYEQWIRGDFLRKGKSEHTLKSILSSLLTIGVSQFSYTGLTQKIGFVDKNTCIDYCDLLERMDILMNMQAFDQNKKQGFPKKARKFHFKDPFIYKTILHWLMREAAMNSIEHQNTIVEATVASHCAQVGHVYYFKGIGEVDVVLLREKNIQAIEIKWANQIRSNDLKTLKQFKNSLILGKQPQTGEIENIKLIPAYEFLYELERYTSFFSE